MRMTLELDFVWDGSLTSLGYSFEAGNKFAAFNWDNLRIANNALSTCFFTNVVFGVGVLYGSTSG